MAQTFRQCVITVYPAAVQSGAPVDIIFRQPYHNLGLAISYQFVLDYFQPYADCNGSILNPSNAIVDAFYFDPKTYKNRPLIEIRAGHSSVKITSLSEVESLKRTLPLRYTGHPTFFKDNKINGGRRLEFSLSNIEASSRSARVGKTYAKGRKILSVLADLAKVAKIKADFSALKKDTEFSAKVLANTIFYNNVQVMSQALPRLAKLYGFVFMADNGRYLFKLSKTQGPVGALIEINERNGMIEHPVSLNWVQWSIKTLYGQPDGLQRGGWAKVASEVFNKAESVSPTFVGPVIDSTLQALILNESHVFNDSEAFIEYTVSPDGQPINSTPELRI